MSHRADLGLDYVEPLEPDNSYIVRKVEGTGNGSRMPFGQPPLSTANIDLLRQWIAEGAVEDDMVADTDGDGTVNGNDSFPLDDAETADTDNDGVGDNADAFPSDGTETVDSDSDGVGDNADAFPSDATETVDSDSDGVGDNADAFPSDATETVDSDSDGVGDNADAFPSDGTETVDSDSDGVGDNADAFPSDGTETVDSDSDGVGDNADAFPSDGTETVDSDSDGVGDNADAFPSDATETVDSDSDGVGDNADAFPNDATETADSDMDGIGDNADEFPNDNDATNGGDACMVGDARDESTSTLAVEKRISIANPGSNVNKQSLLRVVNDNDATTNVEIYGIDDGGARSRQGPISFSLAPNASTLITAQEIEGGRAGFDSNLCDGEGKWQFRVRSDNPVEVMGLIRTPDLFMTGLNDVAPDVAGDRMLWFGNPASNVNRVTFLRIVSFSDESGTVTITGIDDAGVDGGSVSFTLAPNASRQLTVQELENGTAGLTGQLADGTGKWRFRVSSDLNIEALSLIRTADGFLSNLSGEVEATGDDRVIYFANPASNVAQQTFIRIVNNSDATDTVTISGIDDNGNIAPMGSVTFTLGAQQAKQLTIQELENGTNPDLMGMLGDGEGRWRLTISAPALDLRVQSLIRTESGFLTNLSRTIAEDAGVHRVWFFNPASNVNKVSSVRLVNNTNTQGSVTISGIDDAGNPGPNGDMTFNIMADGAMTITAVDLEDGNSELGLVNPIGNGTGKWRLTITSDVDLRVQSLLGTPGFLSNLSRTVE